MHSDYGFFGNDHNGNTYWGVVVCVCFSVCLFLKLRFGDFFEKTATPMHPLDSVVPFMT